VKKLFQRLKKLVQWTPHVVLSTRLNPREYRLLCQLQIEEGLADSPDVLRYCLQQAIFRERGNLSEASGRLFFPGPHGFHQRLRSSEGSKLREVLASSVVINSHGRLSVEEQKQALQYGSLVGCISPEESLRHALLAELVWRGWIFYPDGGIPVCFGADQFLAPLGL